jgi:hypothetical protein
VQVSSRTGWQPTGLGRPGERFAFQYISGSWSVDYRNFPYVGMEGYSDAVDRQIYQGCKLNQTWNYGLMLAQTDAQGQLFLRIHDSDQCLGDNDGAITVKITSQGATSARWVGDGTRMMPAAPGVRELHALNVTCRH